jgi:hypothetical protein
MLYCLSGFPAYLPPLAVIESFAFASFTRPSIDLMTSPALASASSATATLPVESEIIIIMNDIDEFLRYVASVQRTLENVLCNMII